MYVLTYKDKSIYIPFLCIKITVDNVLLNINMMLDSSSLELIQIALLKVFTLWTTQLPLPPAPSYHSTLCFCEFDFFGFLT